MISVAATHHGYVKDMHDVSVARSEWQQIVRSIKPGVRLVVINFAADHYDVGGRMDPPGIKGHGAANANAFPRQYGACINAFIETGMHQPPCP